MTTDKTFTKAINYKSTPEDIRRMVKKRKIENKKEELRLKKEMQDYS